MQADLGLHQPWLVFDVRLKAEAPNLMPDTRCSTATRRGR
jgi:hypothetical protein